MRACPRTLEHGTQQDIIVHVRERERGREREREGVVGQRERGGLEKEGEFQ